MKPKATKISAGKYRVDFMGRIMVIKNMNNPNLILEPYKGWEIWSVDESLETTDNNCWASGPKSKKQAIEFIVEQYTIYEK